VEYDRGELSKILWGILYKASRNEFKSVKLDVMSIPKGCITSIRSIG